VRELRRSFGAVKAVDRVSFQVGPGEIVSLLGPSGCGKSTLLRLVAGIETPDEGSIALGGRELSRPGHVRPPEVRGVGLVFQDYALFPHLSVLQNVLYGLRRASPRDHREALTLLEQVGLGAQARSFPHTLSGGEQQRVALLRSLAPRPLLLLLDEPFAGLDTVLRASVRAHTVQLLKERGCPALVVTHDPEEAMEISDRIILMRAGQIEQQGPPGTLYLEPRTSFAAGFFGRPNRLAGLAESPTDVRCGPWRLRPDSARFAALPVAGQPVEVIVRQESVIPAPEIGQSTRPETAGQVLPADLRGLLWSTGTVRLEIVVSGSDPAVPLMASVPAWQWRTVSARMSDPRARIGVRLEPSGVHVFPA
jgi:iron(III) transport system ATP-binding protein